MNVWVLMVSGSCNSLPSLVFERESDAKKALHYRVESGVEEGCRVQLSADGLTGSVNHYKYEIVGANLVKADPFDEVTG